LYVTGDIARYLAGGKIEFVGRPDQQVKLRGHRIELGEIEATLERHPAIRQSAVLLQKDSRGDHRLVAYVVSRENGSFNPAKMRDFLKGHLPEYMIPAVWVKLDDMPLTPNGKIHRQGLPAAAQGKLVDERTLAPPRTPVEQVLVDIWAEVLDVDAVGIHDNFFKIGGHSLLVAQLLSRLRESFQIELPLRAFFEAPTVAELAEVMTSKPEQRVRIQRIAELMISIANYSDDEVEAMLGNDRLIGG
jgi:acyl carrier protein